MEATALPRGGIYVQTSAGAIQFGLPPETIKDSMALGLPVPTTYFAPTSLFDKERGLNVAECEFPAYYNYYVLKRKIRMVVEDAAIEARIRTVFEESLFGPGAIHPSELTADFPEALRPDVARERDHFRARPDGTRVDVDTLVDFVRFSDAPRVELGPSAFVERAPGGGYVVHDGDDVVRVPERVVLPERTSLSTAPSAPFEPPSFGVTVLGGSHGFDPRGKTTGFVIWVGRRGVLVDPPVDATEALRAQGVPPKLIDSVILTHCHADHDSGTFQKILEEGRIHLTTTPTILGSFLRKYAALSGMDESILRRTFIFHPARIGAPIRLHGAELRFFYTLHSIPAIGIEVFHGGKSLVISGDTLYDPPKIRALCESGVISEGRRDALIGFPFHHAVVLHEAGVPPLHTPASVLGELPDDVKERLFVVHIAEKDIPKGVGLKAAPIGLSGTIRIEVPSSPHEEAIDLLSAFAAVDLFRDFPLSRASELLRAARRVDVLAGTQIIGRGTKGDAFYVIVSGIVTVVLEDGGTRRYQAGDYFGETSLLLDQPRAADVFARTDVSLVAVSRTDFLCLLRGTDIPSRLVRLAQMRAKRSWEIVDKNSLLRKLTSAPKTLLQSSFVSRPIEAGSVLWRAGEPAREALLIDEGSIVLEGAGAELAPFCSGAFLGEVEALCHEDVLSTTARVVTAGRAFFISREDLSHFFQLYPGLLLSFFGAKFVE